ncbi:MAG: RNA polymerase sigma factor [Lachnospiraceae bacterium]|nr:RNA polymerase sigma factor [Lachnospiraceae bacterium]
MKQTSIQKKAFVKKGNTIVIDESIFEDIARGDKVAFSQLYEASSKAIYAYLLTYVKNPEDAADLMQDTYLKIRSAAGLYKPYGKPMAWIFTIARNLALMKLRKDTAHPQEELSEIVASRENPQEQVENKMILSAAMEILSPEDYRIVMLHAVSGMKHREIAELMGLSLTNTVNRYNRALKKLKKQIGGDHYE